MSYESNDLAKEAIRVTAERTGLAETTVEDLFRNQWLFVETPDENQCFAASTHNLAQLIERVYSTAARKIEEKQPKMWDHYCKNIMLSVTLVAESCKFCGETRP